MPGLLHTAAVPWRRQPAGLAGPNTCCAADSASQHVGWPWQSCSQKLCCPPDIAIPATEGEPPGMGFWRKTRWEATAARQPAAVLCLHSHCPPSSPPRAESHPLLTSECHLLLTSECHLLFTSASTASTVPRAAPDPTSLRSLCSTATPLCSLRDGGQRGATRTCVSGM